MASGIERPVGKQNPLDQDKLSQELFAFTVKVQSNLIKVNDLTHGKLLTPVAIKQYKPVMLLKKDTKAY